MIRQTEKYIDNQINIYADRKTDRHERRKTEYATTIVIYFLKTKFTKTKT